MATRARVNSALRAQHMPAHLRHLEGTFKNARGQNLSYLALFPPASTPLRAVVLYLHGIGDHSRRYFHLYERLCDAGFGVLAYDLLSHGASDSDHHGLRAHSARFQYFVDDTNEFIKLAKTQLYPQLALPQDKEKEPKLILAGMSYGTLVSLHTILSGAHGFSGVVLVAPALLVEMTTTLRVQAVFARPLSKLIPKARIVPGVNGDYLCRDQDYVNDFKADPLTVSEPVTARMGAETLKAMRALEADKRVEDKESALCKLPMLMMMGSNDKVTSLELAQVFYDRLAAQDKEFKVFDDYFHALFDDPESEAVFVYLDNWLKKRFPVPEGAEKAEKIEEGDEEKAETEEETTKEEKKIGEAAKEETQVETVGAEGAKVEAAVTEKVEVEAAVTEEIAVTKEKEVEAVQEENKTEAVKEEPKQEAKVETVAAADDEKEVAAAVKEETKDAEAVAPEEKKADPVATEEVKAVATDKDVEIVAEAAVTEETKVEASSETTVSEDVKTEAVESAATEEATLKSDDNDARVQEVPASEKTDVAQVEAAESSDNTTKVDETPTSSDVSSKAPEAETSESTKEQA